MTALNEDVYARVQEKAKEHNLTEQEIKVIEKARDQLQTQTSVGGMVGASVAFFLGKAKKFNPIQILAITGGGFLMGSQMGLISGALSGVKAINSVPNPQRLINIIREVQMETMQDRQVNGVTPRPGPIPPRGLHTTENPQDQFSPEIPEFQNNDGATSLWNRNKEDLQNTVNMNDQSHSISVPEPTQQTSAWERIRSGNLPTSSWAKIRNESIQHPENDDLRIRQKEERLKRLRENNELSGEELPRTREESAQKGMARRNQWGDPLE
ncbi:hypothetical protein BDB01DRAFT_784984 [Pilobolus umbonatus]|nr:hypothetical protein BDB01DRAFT_784984 [Pilobolus umbonatus]